MSVDRRVGVVELIGLPAAGKTTIARSLGRALEAQGLRAVSFPDDAREIAGRSRLGRFSKLLTFGLRPDSVGWLAYRLSAGIGTIRFVLTHPRLVFALTLEGRVRPVGAATSRRRPLYWTLRHAGDRALFRRVRRPDEVLVADEGFAHRVVQLFASPVETPRVDAIERYLDVVERADLYVDVNVPISTAATRLRTRGTWDWLPEKDVDAFLSSAESAIEAVRTWLAARGREVAMVDNRDGIELEAAARDIVRRLEETAGRQPRVLMVCRLFHPWIGGMERQALKLAKSLRAAGVPVVIATGWWYRGTPRTESIDGVPVVRNFTFWEFSGIRGVRRLGHYVYMATLATYLVMNRHRYDVIHVHGLSYHTFVAARVGRLIRRPVVAKLANSGSASDIRKLGEASHLPGTAWMLGSALDCDRMVAISEAIAAELVAAGVDRQRVVEIPNGVELPASVAGRAESPQRLLFLGRLHSQKGLATLLEALAVLGDRPRLSLDVVGDGPERRSLERLATDLGIAPIVRFHGEQTDADRFLSGATALVLPSRAEGLSNSLLEAMANGLPVIVSDIPANTDVVEHGVEGLVFAAGDVQDLAACIAKFADDPASGRVFGANARATAESRYRIDVIADRYRDLYAELIEGRSN